jgi:hypothetical protein
MCQGNQGAARSSTSGLARTSPMSVGKNRGKAWRPRARVRAVQTASYCKAEFLNRTSTSDKMDLIAWTAAEEEWWHDVADDYLRFKERSLDINFFIEKVLHALYEEFPERHPRTTYAYSNDENAVNRALYGERLAAIHEASHSFDTP